MADVAVGVRLTMRILVGLTDKGRRRDHAGITRGPRVFVVKIKPIAVANGEREITNRSPSDFLRCGVVELAPDPSLKFICKKTQNRRFPSYSMIANESTSSWNSG